MTSITQPESRETPPSQTGRLWRANWSWIVLAAVLLGLGLLGRWLPHPPNFSPAASIALFAGFALPNRRIAAAVILGVMALSDVWLGGYDAPIMAVVYVSLLVPLLFRPILRQGQGQDRIPGPGRVVGAALVCSLIFFAATNFAVWATWYPRTWSGLTDCFAYALPFFRYTVAGDLCWSCGLFGVYSLALRAQAPACDSPYSAESRELTVDG